MRPLMDKETNEMWPIRMREYYLASKREEILTYAITRMNPKVIMLGEISPPQKDRCCVSVPV